MKLKIAIDIDSTLYNFTKHARLTAMTMAYERLRPCERQILLTQGADAPWPEWRSPDDIFGHDLWMEILDRTHSPEEILKQKPFEDAVRIINEWIQAGHDVFFISSRDPDETAEATEQWLVKIGIQNPRLVCTGRAGSKIPTLIMYDTQVLIDDRPQTLVEFAYDDLHGCECVAAIGIAHPYNQGLSDLPRIDIVRNWSEINDRLENRLTKALMV